MDLLVPFCVCLERSEHRLGQDTGMGSQQSLESRLGCQMPCLLVSSLTAEPVENRNTLAGESASI